MLKLRVVGFLALLSLFLVSCGHPLISVEVKTGGEIISPPYQGPPSNQQPGCWPPMTACPGTLNVGNVVKKDALEGTKITFYTIKVGQSYRNFSAPPTVIEGTLEVGNTVEIIVSDDGTITIKKAS